MKLNFDLKLAIAIVLAVAVVSLSVYLLLMPRPVTDMDRAVYRCVFLCKSAENTGLSLDSGPCLSAGSPEWDIDGWVCDVAHYPREDRDGLPQNQCPGYGSTASHFVEVTPDCSFIRAV